MANATLRYQEFRKKKEEENSPVPCSLFPVPCSLFPVPCFLT
ncbi:hypothetical protein [Dolichospermum circinale]|nr:hypothetical protein [Dolichospermum circinale]MDB9452313.1 hypothetical protein [Dolichospermum circinale CS-547]